MDNDNSRSHKWWNNFTFEEVWYLIIKNKNLIKSYPDTSPYSITNEEIEAIWVEEINSNQC